MVYSGNGIPDLFRTILAYLPLPVVKLMLSIQTLLQTVCKMRNLKTVGDVTEIIAQNLNSDNLDLKRHAQTLLGPREHGSTTKLPLSSVNKSTEIYRLNDPNDLVLPGCVAYTFEAPQLGGKLGALPYGKIASLGLADKVETREGKHGAELVIPKNCFDSDTLQLFTDCPQITVILGEFVGEVVVFTWHPGAPLKPGTDLEYHTAVKLVD